MLRHHLRLPAGTFKLAASALPQHLQSRPYCTRIPSHTPQQPCTPTLAAHVLETRPPLRPTPKTYPPSDGRTTRQVLLLKYDQLLRQPLDVVREAHSLLNVFTSQPKLTAFVKAHLDPNYTVATVAAAGLPVDAPVVDMKNVSGGRVVVHKLRKRLKTEFGTVRPVSMLRDTANP